MKTNIVETDFTRNGLYANANQVNADQNTGLAQNAQDTADNAADRITNLNDPNLMSVIEKQTAVSQYAGLTSQYNVILARAKDANANTTALTTAYTSLNTFMTAILMDTTKASDVDRDTYNSLTDAYNTALSKVKTALSNSYNTDIDNMSSSVSVASQAASSATIAASQAATTGNNASQVASQAIGAANQAKSAGNNAISVANNATSVANSAKSTADSTYAYANSEIAVQSTATTKAQSTADNAFSQAQAVGSQASAEIAVQSNATAKAQSTADNAFSQATTAIDNGKVTSQAVTNLKDGSKLTIADLENGLATKVANSDYASYKEQTASQIGEMVTNGAFSAYQTQTADLIAQKVATKDFSSYKDQTATAINSKVDNGDFNTYKTQTADLIDDKVSNSAYASDKTQTASEIADRVSNSAFSTYQTQTASQIASKVDNGDFSTYKTQTADLISSKVATKDFSSYKDQTATAINSKVDNGDFNTYKTQTANTLQTLVGKSPSNIIKDGGFNSAVVGQIPSGWNFSSTAQIAANPNETNGLVALDHPVLQINSKTSGNSDIYYGDWFDVQPGDQFYAELKARWSSMSQKGGIVLGVVTKNAAEQRIWTGAVTITSPSNWAKYTGVLTIPDGAVQGRVWVAWQGSAAADEAVFVTDLVVRPAYSTQSDITQAINNIHLGFKNPDGSNFQMNLSADGVALLDFSKIILNGSTNITNGTIGTAQIANAAITDAQVGNVSANKLTAGTIDFNTITGKNINASNITTGTLSTDRLNVGKLSALSADLGNVTAGTLKGVNIVAKTFSTPNGSFTTDANGAITANNMTLIGGTLTSPTINASTINGSTINTPDLNLGDNGRLTGSYSVNDDISYFQPIRGTGSLHIEHGYIQSTANVSYYNKILNGISGDKWGHWASSTQFIPATDQANPGTGNVAESTLTPAFLKLDIFNADKSLVKSRAYIDGTGLYINDGQTQSIVSMLSDYELISNGMAYLNSGIEMKKHATFTFGNLVLNGYHTIAMLDGKAINFTSATSHGSPIEVRAKTFTKLSRLSIKHDITPLSTAESSRLLNAIDVEKFRYTHDGATYKYQYGGVIDDVNSLGSKQYSMPSELLSEDGTGINLDSLTGILIKTVQEQERKIGKLSMRLTRLEMEK